MSAAVSQEFQPEAIPLQENAEIPVTEKIVLPPKKKSWLQTFKEKIRILKNSSERILLIK